MGGVCVCGGVRLSLSGHTEQVSSDDHHKLQDFFSKQSSAVNVVCNFFCVCISDILCLPKLKGVEFQAYKLLLYLVDICISKHNKEKQPENSDMLRLSLVFNRGRICQYFEPSLTNWRSFPYINLFWFLNGVSLA